MFIKGGFVMARTCKTCKSCVSIKETCPYGQCLFFTTGPRNVNIYKDFCPNHSEELKEEAESEREFYERRKQNGKNKQSWHNEVMQRD